MKILMAGLGGIGQRHLRNLRALLGNDVEIIAYRVRRLSSVITPTLQVDDSLDVEKVYGLRVFGDLDSALAERPDVSFICNPSSLHVPTALACVEAGSDIFVEKPLSNDLTVLPELQSAIEKRGTIAMVGYQLRFHPCFLRMQEIIKLGLLGNLLGVRATVGEYLPNWHRYEDYRTGYAARASLGGGVVLSQIHEFDYLYALFGEAKRLFSVAGHWSNLEVDVEDVASTLMQCEYAGRPLPVHLQQDYLQRPAHRQCEVVGDAGKAILDFPGLSVTLHQFDGATEERFTCEGLDRNLLFVNEIKHFLDCVKTRKKPLVDLAEGTKSLRLALAAKESAASGRVVELS
ncbi:oxidoreductase domain protein [Acidisarcina polymorpha]|uniref:Oxidoreductase domain protein n=1 Tax=Acidisarcina polymorpha TaxID=2211140 RepID=A0A2Z5FYS8_9BACT|nr:Gfo/Idh/MocA family oxidoreductase [Acidisarcina polymorpha]AXC11526.1 oxidoreductase domain protein [Acidisarcina polymorpha]